MHFSQTISMPVILMDLRRHLACPGNLLKKEKGDTWPVFQI